MKAISVNIYILLLSRYSVEFSKPTKQKPIPEGTVKVLFDIIQLDGAEYEIEFNFENESLKHRINNTMRTNMFQVSLITDEQTASFSI